MLFLLIFAAIAAAASTTSSTSFDSGVPTDTPIPGDYTGALRPQIHFSPPKKFLNDPNGCFLDADGTWHLYYQYNPTDNVAGNQHWGHATSQDLYHWQNQKIAIFATEDAQIFSGSVVIDSRDTTGFFPDQTNGVVAIYTLNTKEKQTQEIAISHDGGYTFQRFDKNPVIDSTSTQFRDPKVIWYENHWVMVVAHSQEFVISIYTSWNLISWTHASNFSHHGLLGLQYECPNLVSMPMEGSDSPMYVMTISINPGAPLGGSIMQYFPGTFNGTHFEAVDAATRISDFGKDNYAGQFFYGLPETEDQVLIAWASNWQYCEVVPTGDLEDWRSSMSLPRKTRLANVTRLGYDLISAPYNLPALSPSVVVLNGNFGNGTYTYDYSADPSGALYFQVNVTCLPTDGSATGTLNFTFQATSTKESISGGYYFGRDTPFWLDRGGIDGFDNPFFTDKFSTNALTKPDGIFMLEGVIDRTILEVFLNGGQSSATTTFFPNGPLSLLTITAAELNENLGVSLGVWVLKSAWADQASSDGIVYGNRPGK